MVILFENVNLIAYIKSSYVCEKCCSSLNYGKLFAFTIVFPQKLLFLLQKLSKKDMRPMKWKIYFCLLSEWIAWGKQHFKENNNYIMGTMFQFSWSLLAQLEFGVHCKCWVPTLSTSVDLPSRRCSSRDMGLFSIRTLTSEVLQSAHTIQLLEA